MNETLLDQKLQALARFPILVPEAIQNLGADLRQMDDWDLSRLNPLRFASEHQLEANAAMDLFIHAVKVGLFDFSYNQVCPGCGGVEYSHRALDEIASDSSHCTNCDSSFDCALDNQVHVTFTLNPSVGALKIDPYADSDSYRRYFSADTYAPSQKIVEHFEANLRGFVVIQCDEAEQAIFQTEPNTLYRVANLETHSFLHLQTTDENAALPQIVDVDLLPNGFAPNRFSVAAGALTLHVHNRTKSTVGIVINRVDMERVKQIMETDPVAWKPYLTGKMLLNNQSFRELFRIQSLAPNLKLNLRSQTILFTDLKGSTEMYGQAGDVTAYSLVQEHFDMLIRVVRRHSGSIVKTMGDAIMATFSTPQDGTLAALDMAKEMSALQERFRQQGYEMGIKIGLNEGAALVVNADERLDYFGQSVNMAARVQGLAQAGEIWMTDSVFAYAGIAEILEKNAYKAVKQSALLKGVSQPTTVFQCVASLA